MNKYGFVEKHIVTSSYDGDRFMNGFWEYPKHNSLGENLGVEVHCCYNTQKDKKSLPMLWYKGGRTTKPIYNYLSIETEVTQPNGECFRKYEFVKKSADGKRWEIDFDWLLEQSSENLEKLIKELLRRFLNA
jgi:hypothetical protein